MNGERYQEGVIDRRVQRRLASDAAYRNAANAEEQAAREEEITREEEERLYHELRRAVGWDRSTARLEDAWGF